MTILTVISLEGDAAYNNVVNQQQSAQAWVQKRSICARL